MKTSTNRILTTHVGSLPRPESIRTLLRARVSGGRGRPTRVAVEIAWDDHRLSLETGTLP
jgi:methionine synthase II (cobalamin-independent)